VFIFIFSICRDGLADADYHRAYLHFLCATGAAHFLLFEEAMMLLLSQKTFAYLHLAAICE
jgi:hypothetical protein